MSKKWLSGVTHSHTVASDGKLTLEQLVALAKKNKLDYLIITDHNVNCEKFVQPEGLTLIYGTELTCRNSHTNIWGVQNSVDDFTCDTYEQWLSIKTEAQRRGALVCMNHPFCTNCPWRWEKDISQVDVLEIWNAPMHYDNIVCTNWWREQLKNGHRTPIVGGSDYHKDYYVTNLLPNPVTYVYSESSSPEDILAAIAEGHTTIASGVGKTMIELTSGNAVIGDSVKLTGASTITIKVRGLKAKHCLKVFDADGEFYSYKAGRTGDFIITLPVRKPGFICAQVENTLGIVFKFGYNIYIGKRIPSQKDMELPPFIYAQSGAIFFEV